MEERCLEWGVGRRYSTLPKSPGRSSMNLTFWVFREASLYRLDWWNPCPVATDSMISSPSPFHDKTKISSLAKQRAPSPSYHLGNAKSFRSSLLVMGMKIKCLFLVVNHSMTEIRTTWSSCDDQTIDRNIYMNYLVTVTLPRRKPAQGGGSQPCTSTRRSAECTLVLGEGAQGLPAS